MKSRMKSSSLKVEIHLVCTVCTVLFSIRSTVAVSI